MVPISRRLAALFLLMPLVGTGLPAKAQDYPARPITLIVPFAPGGPTDVAARIAAHHMAQTLRQRILVENVAGAGGASGAQRARLASPDGYTILVGNLGAMASNVALTPNLPYDPVTDFEPIGMINLAPMVVVAKPQSPIRTLGDFTTLLAANKDKMAFGSGGQGSTSHLACLFLESEIGARGTHVPYRGTLPALNDLMSGSIDYLCDQATILVPQVQAGAVKALVVSSMSRLKAIPDVPNAAEAGVPGFQMYGWNALFAPKGTPGPVLDTLRDALKAALADEIVMSRFEEVSSELPGPDLLTGPGLRAFVSHEIGRWTKLVREAGLVP